MARLAELMNVDVVEQPDQHRWVLPLSGEEIVRCCVDWAVIIEAVNDVAIRIEQPFVFSGADGTAWQLIPAGDPVELAPVLAVARLTFRDALAFEDGHLELRFTDGSSLRVPRHEDYEPWELTGPRGLKLVSLPGGGVAVWKPVTD